MRPPAPPAFRRNRLSDSRLARWLDQPTRIMLRQIIRWPMRSALTTAGVAMAVLVMANQWRDSIDHMIKVYYVDGQHQDVMVGLVEPMRITDTRFRAGTRWHRGALYGIPPDTSLQPIYDAAGKVVDLPPDGLVLATKLAQKLGVGQGDLVTVEVLEGRRPERALPVVRLFETYVGMPALQDLDAFNRMLREPFAVDYVNLLIDQQALPALFARLKDLPGVASVVVRQAAIDVIHATIGESMMIFISFFSVFASLLAFGVVYSSARIALSEGGRELATLRVLGFSHWEISYVLLGQLGFLVVVALPLGCALGWGLVRLIMSSFETELFRVPLVIEASTFGIAMLLILIATVLSAALIRRRVERLDLIAVLKTRE